MNFIKISILLFQVGIFSVEIAISYSVFDWFWYKLGSAPGSQCILVKLWQVKIAFFSFKIMIFECFCHPQTARIHRLCYQYPKLSSTLNHGLIFRWLDECLWKSGATIRMQATVLCGQFLVSESPIPESKIMTHYLWVNDYDLSEINKMFSTYSMVVVSSVSLWGF